MTGRRTSELVRALKSLAFLLVGLASVVLLFVGSVSYLYARSEAEITRIVSEIPPGTSLSTVLAKLGKPAQVCRGEPSVRGMSLGKNPALYSSSDLYMFPHRAIPYRWILVYTDKGSSKVKHADWVNM
jgi:hypothetical protein